MSDPLLALTTPTTAAAAGAAITAAAAVLSHALFVPQSNLFGQTDSRLCPTTNAVALTFDDGPLPGSTDAILDILGEHNTKATFFVIGRYAAAHPALIERIHREGHQLGNHTFDHHRTGLFHGRSYWKQQIERTNRAIAEVTGAAPRDFRPPMGFKAPPMVAAARALNHRIVAWSKRGFDGVTTTPERILHALRGIQPKDIVLLHDGRDPASRRELGATSKALPELLAVLRDRGLTPVRLDEGLDPAQSSVPLAPPRADPSA